MLSPVSNPSTTPTYLYENNPDGDFFGKYLDFDSIQPILLCPNENLIMKQHLLTMENSTSNITTPVYGVPATTNEGQFDQDFNGHGLLSSAGEESVDEAYLKAFLEGLPADITKSPASQFIQFLQSPVCETLIKPEAADLREIIVDEEDFTNTESSESHLPENLLFLYPGSGDKFGQETAEITSNLVQNNTFQETSQLILKECNSISLENSTLNLKECSLIPSENSTSTKKHRAKSERPSKITAREATEKNTPEYFKKRERNNESVRKSRDKARQKQLETEGRVQVLSAENQRLQTKVDDLERELAILRGLFSNVGAAIPKELIVAARS